MDDPFRLGDFDVIPGSGVQQAPPEPEDVNAGLATMGGENRAYIEALWRGWDAGQRRRFLVHAASFGIMPDEQVDLGSRYLPAMAAVPWRGNGEGNQVGQTGSVWTDDGWADVNRTPPGLLAAVRDLVARLVNAALGAVRGALDALRNLLAQLAGGLGNLGLILLAAAGALLVLAVVRRNGRGARRVR